jgi:hypothetical protein
MSFRDKLIQECIILFRRDDIKKELKQLMSPIISLILKDIYPYIYLSLIFVIISFLLILGIFILLLRINNYKNM